MKNADMPAMPLVSPLRTFATLNKSDLEVIQQYNGAIGLTKREQIAMAAMQGLLASGHFPNGRYRIEDVTNEAVNHADALLEALETKS